jgi:hypothetical protein
VRTKRATPKVQLLAVMLLALAPGCGDSGDSAQVRRIGQWLVDRQGQVVVVPGFNVVQKNLPFVLEDQEPFALPRSGRRHDGHHPSGGSSVMSIFVAFEPSAPMTAVERFAQPAIAHW